MELIETGRIINTHGLSGEVKVEPWADSPAVVAELDKIYVKTGDDYNEYPVKSGRVRERFAYLKLGGIDSIDDANLLRNRTIYCEKSAIPLKDGGHLIVDLIGLPVIDSDSGKRYGTVSDYSDAGGHGLFVLSTDDGRNLYLPDVAEFVVRIDDGEGIFVHTIEGLFE